MKIVIPAMILASLVASAWAGEKQQKPIDPAKELWNFGRSVCAYLPSAGQRQFCGYDLKDFVKANPAPCAAKDRAIAKLKMAEALCEKSSKTKDKDGNSVVKIQPHLGSDCWHQVVREISGKDAKPFEEGHSYDLSKLNEAVAWAGAGCLVNDRYHEIDSECMHGKVDSLMTMIMLQGINEGPAPATYACADGASDPVLAEGTVAPSKPDVQPRIVTTAELPAGLSGAQIVK